MLQIKIGIFELDYKSLLIFLFGLVIGLLLFGLVFLMMHFMTNNKKLYMVKSSQNVDPNDGVRLVNEAVEDFRLRSKDDGASLVEITKEISLKLLNEEAALFFPKSKRPILMLTVDELIDLVDVLADNIEARLDEKKLLKIVKNSVPLAKFVSMADKEEKHTSELKSANEKTGVLNIFKKFIGDKVNQIKQASTNKIVRMSKIVPNTCELIIRICGEEAYKAFAKKINISQDINMGVDEAMTDINEEEE